MQVLALFTFAGIGSIAGLVLGAAANAAMAGPRVPDPTICPASGTTTDNGCPGCSTSIILACNPGAETCEPCTYSVSASLSCGILSMHWSDYGQLECNNSKYERRSSGCSAAAWGGVTCICLPCN